MKKVLVLIFSAFVFKATAQTPNSLCDSIATKGFDLFFKKNYAASLPYLERGIKVCSRDTGMSDYDYYTMLGALSISYHEIGQEDSAIAKGEPACSYFIKVKKPEESLYPHILTRLGVCYRNSGKYDFAIDCFAKALPLLEKVYGKNNMQYLLCAANLAANYSNNSEYRRSLNINLYLKPIIFSTVGENDQLYADIFTNISNDYFNLSVYDSCLMYAKEAIALNEKIGGKNSTTYAKAIANMATVYSVLNRPSESIVLYEQAKEIYIKLKANNTIEYASFLSQLAIGYLKVDNTRKADIVIHEALDIKLKAYGYYHPDIADLYNTLAHIYTNDGYHDIAVKVLHKSKIIYESTIGVNTSQYATLLTNLAASYGDLKNYDSAVYFFKKGMELQEKIVGKTSKSYLTALNNLAGVYQDMKDYANAEKTFNVARDLSVSIFGKDNYYLHSIYENLGLLYVLMDDNKKADSLMQASYQLEKQFVLQQNEGASEKERSTYAETIQLNNHTAHYLRTKTPLKNEWLFNSTLFYKGLMLESSKNLTAAFSQFTDPVMKKKAEEYLATKQFIGKQLLSPRSSWVSNIKELQSRVDALERELLQASSGFRNWKEQFNINWKNIQAKLGKGETAIEFANYFKPRDTISYYAALVINPGMNDPVLVQLFSEADLNKLLVKGSSQELIVKKLYRSSIKATNAAPQASDSLFHILWKPLLPYLQDTKTIFFAADGVINNLNLAAIITPGGKRLVEDYEFVQLSSTRDVLKKHEPVTFRSIQLWGGIKYDDGSTSATRSTAFAYLPGTLTEVNEIAASAKTSGKTVKVVVNDEANEANFKLMNANAPEVLHIATHGFFFPHPKEINKKNNTDENRFASAELSMLRSGLALSGANNNWKNEIVAPGQEDGIVTANEIADLDLSKTKLVILSACETGLGDIASGEGVYGLQRAFKLAGVDQLIMSLWQVPDLETKEFMQTFYSNCFKGMPVRKAFRETQLSMNKKYQPYQWAAFVLLE